jgi:hypothetical protein
MLVTGQVLSNGSIEGADATIRQAQYFRFATFGSLCSFVVGYNPGVMTGLVERMSKVFAGGTGGTPAAGEEAGERASANNGKSVERDPCVEPVGVAELNLPRE